MSSVIGGSANPKSHTASIEPGWGQGIASAALALLLDQVSDRPLHARAAADNLGSIRVLEKCGFRRIGSEVSFANARGQEIEEAIFVLG